MTSNTVQTPAKAEPLFPTAVTSFLVASAVYTYATSPAAAAVCTGLAILNAFIARDAWNRAANEATAAAFLRNAETPACKNYAMQGTATAPAPNK